MKNPWQEVDYYQNIQMKCSKDSAMLQNFVERERIFEFLARLNVEFDQVLVQVLRKEVLPSINEVFSIICVKESMGDGWTTTSGWIIHDCKEIGWRSRAKWYESKC